jgi:hypothetical protein
MQPGVIASIDNAEESSRQSIALVIFAIAAIDCRLPLVVGQVPNLPRLIVTGGRLSACSTMH